MSARPQWVCWRYEWVEQRQEWAKIPINPRTGKRARSDDPRTWGTLQQAVAAMARYGCDGIGYVFNADDPYTGIDFDCCIDPLTGEVADWAKPWIHALLEAGAYLEVSPSGTGIKAIVRATLPETCNSGRQRAIDNSPKIDGKAPKIEIYHRLRYFTLTGQPWVGASTAGGAL